MKTMDFLDFYFIEDCLWIMKKNNYELYSEYSEYFQISKKHLLLFRKKTEVCVYYLINLFVQIKL